MAEDLRNLARNALGCLDINEQTGRGQELFVVYDNLTEFKPALAHAMLEEAEAVGTQVTLLEMGEFLDAHADDDIALAEMQKRVAYDTGNPLQRNAVNMVAPVGRYDGVRRRLTHGLLDDKAYILQFPFVHEQTARAILSTDPREAEEIALRMKADLDRATNYALGSGLHDPRKARHFLSWPVNNNLRWVVSVGMLKKYSPRGEHGEPKGGWGNPGCEMFTSFAATTKDHSKINGSFYVDAFASGMVLKPEEAFVVRTVNGAVDVNMLREENPNIAGELLDGLVASFTKDQYAGHLGELGIGLMPRIGLADAIETLPLEKIGGTLHIAPGYDESDRGTGGGFEMSKAHNDLGIRRPQFEAKIDNSWKEILANGTSPYFSNVA